MSQTSPHDGQRQPKAQTRDLEARTVVLEIIAMTALALALDTSEDGDPEHARGIATLINETVKHRCIEVGLSDQAQRQASDYADELLSTALLSLFPHDKSKG
ncbi:MAG: hypothetical protein PW791_17640 [Neorhizobium sp.]|jgi:hypothetical protein|nr:hypothetical protein [Neorhizobium sp.]